MLNIVPIMDGSGHSTGSALALCSAERTKSLCSIEGIIACCFADAKMVRPATHYDSVRGFVWPWSSHP